MSGNDVWAAVTAIVTAAGTETGAPAADWDRRAWAALAESGFTDLAVPEELGGGGGDLADVLDVVAAVAATGAVVPVIDHSVAGWAVASTGTEPPGGIGTTTVPDGPLTLAESGGRTTLTGTLDAVPWASVADYLVLPATRASGENVVAIVTLDGTDVSIAVGRDVLGAPLNRVTLENASVDVRPAPIDAADLRRRGALLDAAALASSARVVRDLTVRHTSDRTQFGRPLAKFQAVQQRLAHLASTTAEMERAANDAAATGTPTAVAAATVVVTAAVRTVVATAHQLHGAIGFTGEHALGRHTGFLQSRRDRWGSEQEWVDDLAGDVLAGRDLWELVADDEVSA